MNTFNFPSREATAEEAIAHYQAEEIRLTELASQLSPEEAIAVREEAYAAGSIAAKYKFFPNDWYVIRKTQNGNLKDPTG